MQGRAAILLFCVVAAYAYTISPDAYDVGFGLTNIVDNINTMRSPVSAFPFVNSAGLSKLLVVDTSGSVYTIDDIDGQTGALTPTATPANGANDWAAIGGDIYLTKNNGVFLTDAIGAVLKMFTLEIAAGSTNCIGAGIVVNPFTRHLYIACNNPYPNNIVIDVDAAIFDTHPTGTTFKLSTNDFGVLVSSAANPSGLPFIGLAFSADYQTLYGVAHNAALLESEVLGFSVYHGKVVAVTYWSSPFPEGVGVVAGSGCLSGYLYVSFVSGLLQLDLNGVQMPVVLDSDSEFGGYLHPDPLDGSLLLPAPQPTEEADGDLLRLTAPACGRFAGPLRYFSAGLPVGMPCTVASECSTDSCEDTCLQSTYLGHCQSDVDCNVPESMPPNSWFCQLWRHPHDGDRDHDDSHNSGHKKHRDPWDHDGEGEGHDHFVPIPRPDLDENFFPARYGVCLANACSVGTLCDVNADCIPTGDGLHTCKCHEGYYGTGAPNTCVNPCKPDEVNGGCDVNAICTSTSATNVICTCKPTYAGPGTTCYADPCIEPTGPPCASDEDAHLQFCKATSASTFTCTCGDDYWRPSPSTNPICLHNACATGNPCDVHSTCTPSGTADDTTTCTCHDGYTFSAGHCLAAVCLPLTQNSFPLNAIPHSVVGSCIGLVTGQTCQVGCEVGWRPRGATFVTCAAVQSMPTSMYAVPTFTCVPEGTDGRGEGRGRGGDGRGEGPGNNPPAFTGWICPTGAQCRPEAPVQVLPKGPTSVKLHWTPLHTSPKGDVITQLLVSIQPAAAQVYYSSPINNPWNADGVTINGLVNGVTYTFRLVVVLQSNGLYIAGDPLVVTL